MTHKRPTTCGILILRYFFLAIPIYCISLGLFEPSNHAHIFFSFIEKVSSIFSWQYYNTEQQNLTLNTVYNNCLIILNDVPCENIVNMAAASSEATKVELGPPSPPSIDGSTTTTITSNNDELALLSKMCKTNSFLFMLECFCCILTLFYPKVNPTLYNETGLRIEISFNIEYSDLGSSRDWHC